MALTIILDGLIWQQAGELLFDTEATRAQRSSSIKSYVRALEDITFALLFSENVAATGSLPDVMGTNPGRDLVKIFDERFVPIDVNHANKPEDLLNDADERDLLKEMLANLTEGIRIEAELWLAHMRREALINLGAHESLFAVQKDPSNYRFVRTFWPDRELQDSVPKEILDRVMNPIQSAIDRNIQTEAIREFVTRNVVAHVTIFRWYQRQASLSFKPDKHVYFPWGTRTSLLPNQSGPLRRLQIRGKFCRNLWRIARLTAPYATIQLLERSGCRSDLLKWLRDPPVEWKSAALRQKLSEAVTAFVRGDETEMERLAQDIDRAASWCEYKEVAGIGGEIGVSTAGPSGSIGGYRESERPRGSGWVTTIIRQTPALYSRCEAEAQRVFSELREG